MGSVVGVAAGVLRLLVVDDHPVVCYGLSAIISGQPDMTVVAQAATCDADVEHAACHLTRQDWGVPVVVATDGALRVPLILRGLDES